MSSARRLLDKNSNSLIRIIDVLYIGMEQERFHYESWIFKFIANIFVETEDYLELHSYSSICISTYIYIYLSGLSRLSRVNRVGISHRIKSLR